MSLNHLRYLFSTKMNESRDYLLSFIKFAIIILTDFQKVNDVKVVYH
jgi:hypothetical protein